MARRPDPAQLPKCQPPAESRARSAPRHQPEERGAACRLPGVRVGLGFAIAVLLTTACHFSSEYEAHSSPAKIGVPIEFIVSTDCGLDWMAFDIDGSLWVAKTIDPADRVGTPSGFASDNDVGSLTLLSEDLAEYNPRRSSRRNG